MCQSSVKGVAGGSGDTRPVESVSSCSLASKLVEAKTVQVVVIRGDIHAIAAGVSAVLCEHREARPIPSGNRDGQLVGLPSAEAKSRGWKVPVV